MTFCSPRFCRELILTLCFSDSISGLNFPHLCWFSWASSSSGPLVPLWATSSSFSLWSPAIASSCGPHRARSLALTWQVPGLRTTASTNTFPTWGTKRRRPPGPGQMRGGEALTNARPPVGAPTSSKRLPNYVSSFSAANAAAAIGEIRIGSPRSMAATPSSSRSHLCPRPSWYPSPYPSHLPLVSATAWKDSTRRLNASSSETLLKRTRPLFLRMSQMGTVHPHPSPHSAAAAPAASTHRLPQGAAWAVAIATAVAAPTPFHPPTSPSSTTRLEAAPTRTKSWAPILLCLSTPPRLDPTTATHSRGNLQRAARRSKCSKRPCPNLCRRSLPSCVLTATRSTSSPTVDLPSASSASSSPYSPPRTSASAPGSASGVCPRPSCLWAVLACRACLRPCPPSPAYWRSRRASDSPRHSRLHITTSP